MIDNCIVSKSKAVAPKGWPTVLIADPEGKLKLVRWRLKSDGLPVLYTEDATAAEALIEQNDVRIVLINILNTRDLKNLKKLNLIKGNFFVMAFTASNNIRLKKHLLSSGVRRVFSKPIDFPRISSIIREELGNTAQDRVPESLVCEKQDAPPLFLTKAYKSVLDHIKTAVTITDSRGVIVCVNRPMTLLLQMNEDYLLGKHYREVMDGIPGMCQYELLGLLQKVEDTLEVQSTTEAVAGEGTQPLLPVEAEAHPIFDKRGDFAGLFLAVGEISGSRRLERVAAQSEKLAMVGQLAAGAVHEIKNPLTSVKGFIQLLQHEATGSPKVEYFDIIIEEIDRVNNIVNEFLKLAKPAQPNRRPCDLKKLWKDIRLLMESEAFLLNVNINEDLSAAVKPVLIDGEQIKQVLINVVINSFEAMSGGGDLTVRLYEVEGKKSVCLEISDTGVGMEEETARRIFVPFFTTKANGTGLGLAVSATIMENHGGHMEVKSKIGSGTTTLIYFPYA